MSNTYNSFNDFIKLIGGFPDTSGQSLNILNDVFVKNNQALVRENGSKRRYNFDIVLLRPKSISVPFLGDTGIIIEGVNPAGIPPSESYLTVRIGIDWPIIKYINNFKVTSFSDSISEIFNLVKISIIVLLL